MPDARITIALDREDRERIDALTCELAKLSAQLSGQEVPCEHVVDLFDGVDDQGRRKMRKVCAVLAGYRDAPSCGRCGTVGAETPVEQRFNDWQASRRAVVSDEPR